VNKRLKDEIKLEAVWVRKNDDTTITKRLPLDSYRKEKIVDQMRRVTNLERAIIGSSTNKGAHGLPLFAVPKL
jgi:hypothetical protein